MSALRAGRGWTQENRQELLLRTSLVGTAFSYHVTCLVSGQSEGQVLCATGHLGVA